MSRPRRQYTDEFKQEAVRLVREAGRPIAQVARDLGIAERMLYRWRAAQNNLPATAEGCVRSCIRSSAVPLHFVMPVARHKASRDPKATGWL
ncbi:MAG: transposase [Nitrospiraceae bacterium]